MSVVMVVLLCVGRGKLRLRGDGVARSGKDELGNADESSCILLRKEEEVLCGDGGAQVAGGDEAGLKLLFVGVCVYDVSALAEG